MRREAAPNPLIFRGQWKVSASAFDNRPAHP
jgi:hypothetical protein